MRAWIILSYEWGTRIGESQVQWRQVNLGDAEVEVNGKCGERWLPLSPRGVKILAYFRRLRPDSASPWLGARGKEIGADYIYRLFKRVASKAGIAHLHPHILRHTALTEWAENGVPIPYLMKLSGHQSVSAVLYYVKPSKEKLREYSRMR